MGRSLSATVISASLFVSLAACSGAPTGDPSTQSATSPASVVTLDPVANVVASTAPATRAPLALASTTFHGPARRVADALAQVGLRDDQRVQIQAIASDLEARHATASLAHHDFAQALAEQIAAGAVDRVALAPKLAALSAAATGVQPKERAAFETLHGILDASQRAELVEAMAASGHGWRGGAGEGEGAPGEHPWEHQKGHGPAEQWADDLGLTDSQRVTFKEILHNAFEAVHALMPGRGFHGDHHGKAILEAFKGETFSFDAVAPMEDHGAKAALMAGHMIDVVEKVLPLLTADQRSIAAQKLLERAEHGPMGG